MAIQLKRLKKENYSKLVDKLVSEQGVYAPLRRGERVLYGRIESEEQIEREYILPDMSAKSFVFPRIEKLFGYKKTEDGDVEIDEIDLDAIPRKVIFGIRPCDARGMESLAAIFGWDPEDPIFKRRLERTTFIGMSCEKSDDHCFCTSLGGGPGDTKGSDILLTKTNSGDYIVEIITEKGRKIAESAAELFTDGAAEDKEQYLTKVPVRFDGSALKGKLDASFNSEIFDKMAVGCLGCGACAYICPTCACFDIQDINKGSTGERVRSWDTCGSKLFTLHASGHNPRDNQGARWRQRLMHKFSYLPERLDVLGCVGCGRCGRKCPVGMSLASKLLMVSKN